MVAGVVQSERGLDENRGWPAEDQGPLRERERERESGPVFLVSCCSCLTDLANGLASRRCSRPIGVRHAWCDAFALTAIIS
jgi:hypothetical protein